MKKNKFWILFLTTALALASCSMALNESMSAIDEDFGSPAIMSAEAPRAEVEKMFAEESEASGAYTSADDLNTNVERIVIKNASLSIVVEAPITSMQTISQMADAAGGFVVNSNSYKTTTSQGAEIPTVNITIRVPAEKLDETLTKIKALVEDEELDVRSEDVSGQDVTGEVTDLESRLRNLQAAEEQLLEIMENADTTEDVIAIFQQLTSIREEIEVIQGQIQFYRESASLSAISVYLQAKEAFEPITIAGWQPGLEAQRALQALVEGGQFLANTLIWIIIFVLPILAVILVPVYFIVKFFRKRRQGKNTAKAEKKESKKG